MARADATVTFWYQVGQPKRFTTLPSLEGRTFPSLDRVIERKEMLASARHSDGRLELQKGYDWTGDAQILVVPSSPDAFLEVSFQIAEPELSGLVLRVTHAPDYGTYRIYLDGQEVTTLKDYPEWNPQGPRDLYARDLEVKDCYLGSYTLSPGAHALRFESAGANPVSKGSGIGLDSVRLRARWHTKRKSLRPAAWVAGLKPRTCDVRRSEPMSARLNRRALLVAGRPGPMHNLESIVAAEVNGLSSERPPSERTTR